MTLNDFLRHAGKGHRVALNVFVNKNTCPTWTGEIVAPLRAHPKKS